MLKKILDRFRPSANRLVVDTGGPTELPENLRHASALKRRWSTSTRNEQPPKRGMWVRHHGKTGILTDLAAGDVASVMITDDKGLNVAQISVSASELRQATYEEIPAPRRPDMELARKLGYAK